MTKIGHYPKINSKRIAKARDKYRRFLCGIMDVYLGNLNVYKFGSALNAAGFATADPEKLDYLATYRLNEYEHDIIWSSGGTPNYAVKTTPDEAITEVRKYYINLGISPDTLDKWENK